MVQLHFMTSGKEIEWPYSTALGSTEKQQFKDQWKTERGKTKDVQRSQVTTCISQLTTTRPKPTWHMTSSSYKLILSILDISNADDTRPRNGGRCCRLIKVGPKLFSTDISHHASNFCRPTHNFYQSCFIGVTEKHIIIQNNDNLPGGHGSSSKSTGFPALYCFIASWYCWNTST